MSSFIHIHYGIWFLFSIQNPLLCLLLLDGPLERENVFTSVTCTIREGKGNIYLLRAYSVACTLPVHFINSYSQPG